MRPIPLSPRNFEEMRPSAASSSVTPPFTIEQDHHAIKRRVRPLMGFKTFESARKLIAGIETMHMIKKGNLAAPRA